ncbi:MAG: hypothetical protein KatS3mg102_0155 [Planctomycetota bacterium]|nr:MAG: hypothetical protein KatS3mg102_0155 [Planctomycetota bacterium]
MRWRPIASGERRDALAAIARVVLSLAALGYRLAVGLRAALYRTGVLRVHRVPCPVISVGNLTAGRNGQDADGGIPGAGAVAAGAGGR